MEILLSTTYLALICCNKEVSEADILAQLKWNKKKRKESILKWKLQTC